MSMIHSIANSCRTTNLYVVIYAETGEAGEVIYFT